MAVSIELKEGKNFANHGTSGVFKYFIGEIFETWKCYGCYISPQISSFHVFIAGSYRPRWLPPPPPLLRWCDETLGQIHSALPLSLIYERPGIFSFVIHGPSFRKIISKISWTAEFYSYILFPFRRSFLAIQKLKKSELNTRWVQGGNLSSSAFLRVFYLEFLQSPFIMKWMLSLISHNLLYWNVSGRF